LTAKFAKERREGRKEKSGELKKSEGYFPVEKFRRLIVSGEEGGALQFC